MTVAQQESVSMSTGVAIAAHFAKPAALAGGYDLAVIVPTYNEVDNIAGIIGSLDGALRGIRYEIVFVDDWSQDGTAACIAALAVNRANIRVIRRFDRRGLSSAVIEGMMATMAPIVAVIDGDGQHDEQLLAAAVRAGRQWQRRCRDRLALLRERLDRRLELAAAAVQPGGDAPVAIRAAIAGRRSDERLLRGPP